jgi:hypothetical protein
MIYLKIHHYPLMTNLQLLFFYICILLKYNQIEYLFLYILLLLILIFVNIVVFIFS